METFMKLDYKAYCDKVKGCYLGKNIGGTLARRSSASAACTTSTFLCRTYPRPYPTTTWTYSLSGFRRRTRGQEYRQPYSRAVLGELRFGGDIRIRHGQKQLFDGHYAAAVGVSQKRKPRKQRRLDTHRNMGVPLRGQPPRSRRITRITTRALTTAEKAFMRQYLPQPFRRRHF